MPLPAYLRALASDCEWTDGWEADAPDLINAAAEIERARSLIPELLGQLEFAVKLLSGFPTLSGTAQIGAMRDVIAKAKGQVTLTEYAALQAQAREAGQ